eukprot:1111170_1
MFDVFTSKNSCFVIFFIVSQNPISSNYLQMDNSYLLHGHTNANSTQNRSYSMVGRDLNEMKRFCCLRQSQCMQNNKANMASIYDDLYKKVAALPSDTRIYNCVDLRSRMFNPIKGDVEGFITHTLSNTQAIPDFLSSGNKRRASTSNIDTTPMFIGGPGGPPQRKKRRVNVAHTSPASNYGYSSSSASNYMAPSFANTNQNSPLDSANYRALRPLNTNTNTNNKNTQAMTYQVHAPASVRQETVVPKEDLVLDGILQNVANYGDFVEMK